MGIVKNGTTWGGIQSGTANVSLPLTAQTVVLNDLVVAGVFIRGAASATGVGLTDNLGNTYTLLTGGSSDPAATTHAELWAGFITVAGSATLTWAWTNAGAASSTASAWTGIQGTTPNNALNVAITSNTNTGASVTSGTSPATLAPNCLVLNYTGQPASPVWTVQAFSPAGTPYVIADTGFQTTGADNSFSQFSSTGSGPPSTTQSFSLTTSNTGTAWVNFIAIFNEIPTLPNTPVRIANRMEGPSVLRFKWRPPFTGTTEIDPYNPDPSAKMPPLIFPNPQVGPAVRRFRYRHPTIWGLAPPPSITVYLKDLGAVLLGFVTTPFNKLTLRPYTVALGFANSFNKLTLRAYAVSLGVVTSLQKLTLRAMAVSLGFITTLFRLTLRALSASLGFTSTLLRVIFHILSAPLGLTTTLLRLTKRAMTTVFGMVGGFNRSPFKSLSALVGFTVAQSRIINKNLAVGLGLAGSAFRFIARALDAAPLGFVADLRTPKTYLQAFAVALGFLNSLVSETGFFRTFTATMQALSSMGIIRWYMGTLKERSQGMMRAVSRAVNNIITKNRDVK